MEAAGLATAPRARVAMVWPDEAHVVVPAADLRAATDEASELVDQLHWGEIVRVLGSADEWRYVQAEDHYLGWVRASLIGVVERGPRQWREARVVAVTLAPIHERMDLGSAVIGELPAGTWIWTQRALSEPWEPVEIVDPGRPAQQRRGYVARDSTVTIRDLPHRPPTADDLIATAEAFLGVPYLWGGTTALGMDCSGYVQQVYRLNGVRLDRDADQQAMEGRAVDVPRPGDLIFFGAERVTHVAFATGERTFLNAPESGRSVERGQLGPRRTVRAIRRYLPDAP